MSGFIGVNVNKMPTQQHYFYQNSQNNANRSKNACSCSTSGYSSQSISECGEYPKKHQHQQQLQYVSRPQVAKKYTQADSYSMEFSTQSPSSSSSTWSCSPQQAVRTSTPTHACAINHKLNSNFLSSISTIASLQQQQASPPSPPRTRVLVPERVTIPSPELSVVNKSTGDSSSSSWSFFKFLLYIFSCFNIFKLFKTDADERPTVKCSTPVPLSVPMTVTATSRTIPGHHYYYDEKETYDNLPSMGMITVPQCLLATSQDSLNKAAIQHQATAATTVTTSSVLLSSPSTSVSAFSSINRPQPKQQQPQQIVSSSPLDRYQAKSNFYHHQQHQRPKYSTQTYASSMECIVRQQPQISLICPKVTLATSPQSSNNYLSMINLHQLKPRVSSVCTSASSSSSILPSLPSSQTLSVPAPFYEDYLCDKEVESYFDSSVYYSNVVDYTNEQVVLADCVNKPQFVHQHHNQITPLSMSSPSSSSSASSSSSSGVNSTSTSSSHYHQPTKLNERIKTPARTKTSSFITSGYIRQIQNESYC